MSGCTGNSAPAIVAAGAITRPDKERTVGTHGGAIGGDGFSMALAWLSVAALALLVVWLAIAVIRLRLESLINRRVIASLQKVRPIHEEKAPWWRAFEALPAGIWFALAFAVLLLLYATLD